MLAAIGVSFFVAFLVLIVVVFLLARVVNDLVKCCKYACCFTICFNGLEMVTNSPQTPCGTSAQDKFKSCAYVMCNVPQANKATNNPKSKLLGWHEFI